MKFTYIYIIVLFALSCKDNHVKSYDVKIDFIFNSKVKTTSDSKLYVINESNTTLYYYSDSLDFENYYIAKLFRSSKDANIVYNDVTCKKISDKEYSIDGRKILVERFNYDKQKVEDEEQEIYFTDKFGLLITHSSIWSTTVVYKTDSLSTLLIDEIINDTSVFCSSFGRRMK